METKLVELCREFGVEGECESVKVINDGHINSTFLLRFLTHGQAQEYILQKINKYVFKKPEEVMENTMAVTSHMSRRFLGNGQKSSVLKFFYATSGKPYVLDEEGEYWRLSEFVENSRTFNQTDDIGVIEECGKAFGEFQGLLADFPAEKLNIIIPHFHNTKDRYNQFKKAIREDSANRADEVKEETDKLLKLEDLATRMYEMQQSGELKLKVTHNDTKFNNVLFDKDTTKRLCVIDLDTVMPGLLGHDFGDAIRFIASTAKEDESDLSKVSLDIDKFRAFAKGFLKEIFLTISEAEKNSLALGAITITTELALRFLTDYLIGDKYFKKSYPEQNLLRARCQLKLAESMIEKQGEMNEIIEEIYNSLKIERVEMSIRKTYKKELFSKFAKAINEYDLVQPNDKIAVCISGGKDSMLMAKLFQELKRHNKFHFELVFLVMNPGYSAKNLELIKKNAKACGVPIVTFDSEIFANVEHIEKSPCYICARMRRGCLYSKARELGCNKIALGHHFDDVIETILMGMLYGAQVQTMMPKIKSSNFGEMELIRPMYLIREKDIIRWREYNGLKFLQCACRFTSDVSDKVAESKRQEIKELIAELSKKDGQIAGNIFKSVENVNLATIIAYKDKNGERHHFKDEY